MSSPDNATARDSVRLEWVSHSLQDTARLGQALAACLPPGAVVSLCGPLGAGKTRLVRAIAEALGADPHEVSSPTFVLIHEYQATRPIYHFDAYRLRDDDEFSNLGPEEYFYSNGLSLVEWGDKVERLLPRECVTIQIEPQGETVRRFVISAVGEKLISVLAGLDDQLNRPS